MLRLLSLLALLALPLPALAQQAAPWQQEVHYEMDVHLLADRHQLRGTQRLAYTNHSPDTLRQVFYHLYFNAFQPTSLMAERNRQLPDPDARVVPRLFELGPDEIGYQEVLRLTQDGRPVAWRVYDTVLEVALAEPILPGQTSVFEMDFRSQVPLQTRRSGRDSAEGIDFSMTQWYPKMAAYDALGWHTDPYLGREFYAPFGTFDVRITSPSAYVLGATGVLQNPDAVGHGYDEAPDAGVTIGGPAAGPDGAVPDSLTWHFRAERVHDFAWVADPDYRHARVLAEDVPGREEPVQVHLLFQPDVAEVWQNLETWMPELIRFFSARYLPYPYPQFTVAQGGDGGMEYPMMTLITGRRSPPSLFGVTAHEFAHMWFHSIVATNESDFAWLDEGFTSYASAEAMHHVFRGAAGPANHTGSVATVAQLQRLGLWERPNKPADWFETNLAYGAAAYTGGSAFVSLLGYVMGDAVRDRFLRRYAHEWAFRHPYPADVMQTAQRVSGLQLDWLFEQYLEGAERYDYAVAGLDVERTPEGYRSTVTLRREEAGVLPQDVLVRFEDGSAQWVHVPLGVAFGHKPVPEDWIVAEPWAWVAPTYTLTLDAPQPAVEAIIDPARRTPDIDRANDRVRRGAPDVPLDFAGVLRLPQPATDATRYTLSPIVGYADLYGAGAGVQARATSPYGQSTLQLGVTLWPLALFDDEQGLPSVPPAPDFAQPEGSFLDGIDYSLVYTRQLAPWAGLEVAAEKHLGILENRAALALVPGYTSPLRPSPHRFTLTVAHQHRASDRAFGFYERPSYAVEPGPVLPPTYDPDRAYAEAFATSTRTLFGQDHLLSARLDYDLGDADRGLTATVELGAALDEWDGAGLPAMRFDANRAFATARTAADIGPFTGRVRLLAGIGSEHLAPQKRFRLGAAPVEARWRSDAYRVLAAPMEAPRHDLHFFALSGYGPVAYLLPGTIVNHLGERYERRELFGERILAGTFALEFGPPRPAAIEPELQAAFDPLRFEVFSGLGTLWSNDDRLRPVADAGFGMAYDVGAFEPLRALIAQSDVLSGLRLRAKFPIWVSDPGRIGRDEDAFGFRWLVGVQTRL